jgi:hypothetical protein
VELGGAVVLRERVDLRSNPDEGKERPGDPEKGEGFAETDQLDDVHQHPDPVGDRVLARSPLDVVADLDRHLGDLQAVVADLDQDLRAGAHPLAADVDRLDRPPPVGPKTALGVGDREVVPGKRGRGIKDLHPDLPVGRDIAGRALDEPGADDDILPAPDLREQPGDVPRAVLAVGVDDDELLRPYLPGCRKDRLERPAVALVGRVPDDDRAERLGDRDGLVLRAVVDDEHRIRVLPGADDRLRDVGFFVVGWHRDEGPDGPPGPCLAGEVVDEKACVPAVVPMLDGPVGRPGRGRRSASPGGHRGPSRGMLWIAGSAAGVLSGQERGWGVAGCIMGMSECWSWDVPGVRRFVSAKDRRSRA